MFSKEFPFLEKDFWLPYSTIRAADYSRFLVLAQKGKALSSFSAPDGMDKKKAQQDYQLAELERSFYKLPLVLGDHASRRIFLILSTFVKPTVLMSAQTTGTKSSL